MDPPSPAGSRSLALALTAAIVAAAAGCLVESPPADDGAPPDGASGPAASEDAPAPNATEDVPAPSGSEDAPPDVVVRVVLRESGGTGAAPWSLDPPHVKLAPGDRVLLEVATDASSDQVHNLTLPGLGVTTPLLEPGETATLRFTAAEGHYAMRCGVPGHADLGLAGEVVVDDPEPPQPPPPPEPPAPPEPTGDHERRVALEERASGAGDGPWGIHPPELEVRAGEPVDLIVVNGGERAHHNFTIPSLGLTTRTLQQGQWEVLSLLVAEAGEHEYLCGIPGHAELGMRGVLRVTA